MVVDSLNELKAAFDTWRRGKLSRRESAPAKLAARARRAAAVHGVGPVAKATGMTYTRLREGSPDGQTGKTKRSVAVVPSYSRVEVVAPASNRQPMIEIEMVSGVRLKAFAMTPETFALLTSLCSIGGSR